MQRRKVILDVDASIDDAAALAWALFDPRLEVVAVTAVAGAVCPALATGNLQTILGVLDPTKWPRVGAAVESEHQSDPYARTLYGPSGLGNADFPPVGRANLTPSPKVMVDEIRANAERVSVICLGPLTNLARAFAMDPGLAEFVDQIIIAGGTNGGPGNVTPAAEHNLHCDPLSAHRVLRERATITLVPLDVIRKVEFRFDMLDEMPDETSRAGYLLRQTLPYLFRSFHQKLGQESIYLQDAVTLALLLHPELFTVEPARVDVETTGSICQGALVNDRRTPAEWRHNSHIATDVDPSAVKDAVLRGLRAAGAATVS